jgi:CubicO group peptidase (beta-lactamase class C family)
MENIIMKKSSIKYAVTVILFPCILASCLKDDSLKIPFQSYSPANLNDGWEIAAPADAGIDGEALKEVYGYVHDEDNVWQIRSLLVFRNNKLVAESYMKDRNDITNLHPVWSCTKQVIGILTGIAVDKSLIAVDDPVEEHLPRVSRYPEKRGITVEDLLVMKSGIGYSNDGYNGGDGKLAREAPSGSLDYILGLDLHSTPGTAYRYKNGDPHLISAILQEKTGKTTRDWAKEVLFDRLGISRLEWQTYKDGITFGGLGILTTPREMGKIGQLVLNGGMWDGEQIVSKNWIDVMTSVKVPPNEVNLPDAPGAAFGYLWWKDITHNVNFMMGHGGQCVIINKDKNLMIVITSERHPSGRHGLPINSALSIYNSINSITGDF